MNAIIPTTKLPILIKGDSGDSVRFLEQLLSSIYYFSLRPNWPTLISDNVTCNSVYDDQCKNIVEDFQKNYNAIFPSQAKNITVNGVVDSQTWQALVDTIFMYTYSF